MAEQRHERRRSVSRSGVVNRASPALLALAACGITERYVDERSGVPAGGGQPGFISSGTGGTGMFGSSPGAARGGQLGLGGKAFGEEPSLPDGEEPSPPGSDCTDIPPVVPTCGVEAAAGQGGGNPSGSCALVPGAGGEYGAADSESSGAGAGGEPSSAAASGVAGEVDAGSDSGRVLIDDFEDGDDQSLFALNGRGGWATVNDGSGQQFPAPCTLPSLIEHDARPGSRRGLRTYGSGFLDFAGGYSLVGLFLRGAEACDQPVDASAFDGVEFWARGRGVVRFFVATVATNPTTDAGTCSEGCYDAHGDSVALADDWVRVRMPFAKLVQEGWGAPADFDASQILALQWSAKQRVGDFAPASCFDFWIDDVAFYVD